MSQSENFHRTAAVTTSVFVSMEATTGGAKTDVVAEDVTATICKRGGSAQAVTPIVWTNQGGGLYELGIAAALIPDAGAEYGITINATGAKTRWAVVFVETMSIADRITALPAAVALAVWSFSLWTLRNTIGSAGKFLFDLLDGFAFGRRVQQVTDNGLLTTFRRGSDNTVVGTFRAYGTDGKTTNVQPPAEVRPESPYPVGGE